MAYRSRRLTVAAVCVTACMVIAGFIVAAVHIFGDRNSSTNSSTALPESPVISDNPVLALSFASAVTSTAFSPDGKTLITENENGSIELLSSRTGKVTASLNLRGASAGAFAVSPDGKTLAVGIGDDSKYKVDLFDMQTRKLTRSLPLNVISLTSIAFSPDGRTLAVGGGTDLVLINLRANSSLIIPDTAPNDTIDGVFNPTGEATYVSFSSNGDWLVVAGLLGEIKLWNVRTSQFVKTIYVGSSDRGIPASLYPSVTIDTVAITPNGATVAIGGSTNTMNGQYQGAALWSWSTKSGTAASLINNPISQSDAEGIGGVAFSPQGTLLATGDSTGTIQLWNVSSRQVISTSYSRAVAYSNVSFSPDGRTLATGQWVPKEGSNIGTGALQLWQIYQPRVSAPVTFKNLMSAPVPGICTHMAGKLSGGAQPRIPQDDGSTELAWLDAGQTSRTKLAAFGNLGDGSGRDAAVVLDCNAGGVSWPQVVAFYGPGPTLLGWSYLTNFNMPGRVPGQDTEVRQVVYNDGSVNVEWSTQDNDDPAAISSLDYSAELRLVNGRVVATDLIGTTELPTAEKFLRDLRAGDEARAAKLAAPGVAASTAARFRGQSSALAQTPACYGIASLNLPAAVAPLVEAGSATEVNPSPDRVCLLPSVAKSQWIVLGMLHTGFREWQVAWVRTT